MNLYFTYESRDTLKSFTLFITVKTILNLNAKHSDKYEIKILKFSRRGARSSDNAEIGISRCLFAEDGKEMYKDSKRTCTAIVLLIKPFVCSESNSSSQVQTKAFCCLLRCVGLFRESAKMNFKSS